MYIAKFIAHSGVCSRRNAVELVKTGQISVNGQDIKDVTYIVKPGDKVEYNGALIKPQNYVYILLNKPKDCVTTLSDERRRRTVIDLINTKKIGRVYPVGRLDRMTTGLILLTNDGTLAQKLAHPRFNIPKGYCVTLDKEFDGQDFSKLLTGVKLRDGFIKPDKLVFQGKFSRRKLLIKIHSGKNRVIRRIFERLGYRVTNLDRFFYAGLSKKGLPVGTYRILNRDEIDSLKNL